MPSGLQIVATKLRKAAGQARYVPRALRLAWEAAGARSLAWLCLLFVQGSVPVAIVYLSRPLVDGLAAATAGDASRVSATLWIAASMAGLLIVGEILRSTSEWLRADQAQRIEDYVSALIHAKSTAVDLAFYESADFHDHLHRAREEARYRPVALLQNAGGLLQNGVTLVGMAGLLAPYGIWISVALLASTFPALVVVVRFALLEYAFRQRTTQDERRSWYYDWLMTAGDTAAELRLFGLGPRLRAAYRQLRKGLRLERLRLAGRQAVAEVTAGVVALLIAGACVGWMGWRALTGEVSLGEVALFYFAFSQGQRLMRSLLSDVGQIYYNVLFLGNLFEFLDLELQVRDALVPCGPAAGSALSLAFTDVTFRYPGTERLALRNFSLAGPAGQIAAIVGANGAGKSTLLKLACRFYDPQAGRVELGSIDVREMALEDVRAAMTVLFQQPVRYNASVAENIAVHGAASEAIEEAARAAGAEDLIARLPQRYDTLLGRWFLGGVDLSVGEWQRIALARAFARRTPVILLDEPTSAMDSWAEADWMKKFRALAAGRTALIVTHRFTTAMQADVIHVMDEGRVVESGSHEELLARNGRYAQSWRSQMREAPARSPARGVA
jgi:ATP-binding cassette subfamily B protein